MTMCSFPTPGSTSVGASSPAKQLLGTSPAALPGPACSSGQRSDGEAPPVPGVRNPRGTSWRGHILPCFHPRTRTPTEC